MLGLTFPAFLLSQTVGVTILKLGEVLLLCFNPLETPGDNRMNRNEGTSMHSLYNSIIDLANISGDMQSELASSMHITVREDYA